MSGTISDTTVLSNFAQARQPLLLKALFFPLHVTASVQEELERAIGCLELLIQEGHLKRERGDALLATMISHGYRSPVHSLRDL